MKDAWEACRLQAEQCLEEFRQQRLTEDSLRRLRELIETARPKCQSLLYLQQRNTHPGSQALGMSLFAEGRMQEPPPDPKDWPYQSVLDAMKDGWRVISFPNLALLMDEAVPQSLGCEFILEKLT